MKLQRAWFLGLAVLTAGCGKSDSNSFADSYCPEVAKCCGQAGLPTDGKVCHEWMQFAAMAGSYDANAADACLTEMKAQVSDGTFCSELIASSSDSPCESVYGKPSHNKKPGETCSVDGDCATSSEGSVVCASFDSGSQSIAKCQVRMPGKAGDSPCVGTQDGDWFAPYTPTGATDLLSTGYVCDTANGVVCRDGTCASLATVGAACMISTECIRSAYCAYPADVCAPKLSAGAACTGIAGSECVDSAYCDTTAKQCKPKVTDGGACTSSIQCETNYCSNGACSRGNNLAMQLMCGS